MNSFYFDFLNNIIKQNDILVYITCFLASFCQVIFPPVPGDLFLVYQGYLTYYYKFSILILFLNSNIASFLGSIIVYKFGYLKGDSVFKYKFVRRFISRRQHIQSKKLFRKFGVIAIFISKFLLGINAVTILFSGIFRMRPKYVYTALILSNMVQHALFLFGGRLLAKNMDSLTRILSTYNKLAIAITIVLITALIILYKKSKSRVRE